MVGKGQGSSIFFPRFHLARHLNVDRAEIKPSRRLASAIDATSIEDLESCMTVRKVVTGDGPMAAVVEFTYRPTCRWMEQNCVSPPIGIAAYLIRPHVAESMKHLPRASEGTSPTRPLDHGCESILATRDPPAGARVTSTLLLGRKLASAHTGTAQLAFGAFMVSAFRRYREDSLFLPRCSDRPLGEPRSLSRPRHMPPSATTVLRVYSSSSTSKYFMLQGLEVKVVSIAMFDPGRRYSVPTALLRPRPAPAPAPAPATPESGTWAAANKRHGAGSTGISFTVGISSPAHYLYDISWSYPFHLEAALVGGRSSQVWVAAAASCIVATTNSPPRHANYCPISTIAVDGLVTKAQLGQYRIPAPVTVSRSA
ncbi:hypothetical protein E4U53_005382 [Claviceps sorghi]|nr:hypothetical protein E4U53_005382 [Claviceps sorghi]